MSVSNEDVAGVSGPAAAVLAKALRAGLEARCGRLPVQVGGAAVQAPLPEINPSVRHYAHLLEHPPQARPGRLAPAFRFLRLVLRALLRPWLEFQTRFNQLCIRQLENYRQQVNNNLGGVEQRLQQLAQQVEHCNRLLHDSNHYHGFVNRELGYTGKIADAGLWFNPPVVVQLQDDRARVVAVTERIVEHIFVHTRLPQPPARVLDLGCAESTNALEMASLGYDVVGVDLRELPLEHPSLRTLRADIGNLPLPDDSFDVVVSLSTIEHVGLDWYAKTPEGTNDHRVIAEVKRVLRPGGRLVLTIPFGRHTVTPVHRVYDRPMLDALLAPLRRVETCFAIRNGDSWSYTTDVGRAERADSAERVSAVALVVAEKS
jgi:SAM-dependent methyltransferase